VKRTILILFCAGLWTLALFGGFYALVAYEATPGAVMESPGTWPVHSAISRKPGHLTLIMAVHPRCPCTRASIEELRRILARNSTPVDVRFLFFKPFGADWAPTDLWRQAVAIPGVQAIWDEEGIEAGRFGVRTSGHALLFNPDGKLLFSGGVTSGRGHSGPSKGNLSLSALLTPGETGEGEALVFGCDLTGPQSACTKGKKVCPHP